MTKHRPNPTSDPLPVRVSRLKAEEEAIIAGVIAGDAALARLESSGVLRLFEDGHRPVKSGPRLEVLRTYAEMRRAMQERGHDILGSSLVAAGYSDAEIALFDSIIAAAPSGNLLQPGALIHSTQTEND